MKTPIVIVSVTGGVATAHAYNGACSMVIDWDNLNEASSKNDLCNVRSIIDTVDSYVPNSAEKADLLNDLKETEKKIQERMLE